MTEQLLLQQLESPSGTGRVEPRSQISLPARTSNKRGCKPAHAFSLADMRCQVVPCVTSLGSGALTNTAHSSFVASRIEVAAVSISASLRP